MFSFEEYFRNPYQGKYALTKVSECDGLTWYRLCDGHAVTIYRSFGRWAVDDTRKKVTASRKSYKTFSRAVTHVVMLNAKAIEKILASA